MFYLQLLVLTIIAASYISFIHYIIYKIITEYNKMITIRDYKQNGNLWTKFIRLTFVFISILIVLFVLFNPIFWIIGIMYLIRGNKNSVKVQTNKIGITLFATIPIIIILILFLSSKLFVLASFYFNMFALRSLSYKLFWLILKVDLIFYIILWFKHWGVIKRIYYKTMNKLYDGNRSDVSNGQVEKWICENHTTETIKSKYGILYENIEEWYESDDTKQVYGFFYKFLNIYCSFWIGIVSMIFTLVYFDIPNKIMRFNYSSNMSMIYEPSDTSLGYSFIYIIVFKIILVVFILVGLTYLLNSKLINTPKLYIYNKRQIFIYIITILVLFKTIYIYTNIINPLYLESAKEQDQYSISFSEYKNIIVNEVQNVKNYDIYTTEEKAYTMTRKPLKFKKILIKRGFKEGELYSSDHVVNEDKYHCTKSSCSANVKTNDDVFYLVHINNNWVEIYFSEENPSIGFYLGNSKKEPIDYKLYFSPYLSNYIENLNDYEQVILSKARVYFEAISGYGSERGHVYDDTGYELIVNYDPKNDDQIIEYIEFYLDGYKVAEGIINDLFDEMM